MMPPCSSNASSVRATALLVHTHNLHTTCENRHKCSKIYNKYLHSETTVLHNSLIINF
jgi:hypothetical protein